jgi:hypothetical protein
LALRISPATAVILYQRLAHIGVRLWDALELITDFWRVLLDGQVTFLERCITGEQHDPAIAALTLFDTVLDEPRLSDFPFLSGCVPCGS